MSLVVGSELLSCGAEGLAREASSPDRAVVRPSSKPECEWPACDAAEPMMLGVSPEVGGGDFGDGPVVHVAVGDLSVGDELSQPCCCVRVVFIVIVH